MKTIQATAYEVRFPKPFDQVQTVWESVRAIHVIGEDTAGISVGINENKYYRQFPGETPEAQFHSSCLERRGPAKRVASGQIDVDGRPAYFCEVHADSGYFFYFAVLPLDNVVSIDFVGDCPLGHQDTFLPLFEACFTSLRITGNVEEALAKQKEGFATLFGEREDPAEDTIAAAIPEPETFEIPTDGKEYVTVADLPFEFLDSTEIHIGAYSNGGNDLSVNLKARAIAYRDATHGHVLNDYEDGEVYFNFALNSVYSEGIPTGQIRYEKERDTKGQLMWKGGFRYDLELYGELTLGKGWVGFDGYFRNMTETEVFPVRFAKQIPVDTLAWQHYKFNSMEELLTAPPDIPRHIKLTDLPEETLPDTLYPYTGLESLTIYYDVHRPATDDALRDLSDIDRFTRLKELVLTNMRHLTAIPDAIGNLTDLRLLFITGSLAISVPQAVLALPKLEYCTLSKNRIASLPEKFGASLKSLSLDGNQLTTLPESLTALPNLKRLDITANPLEILPAGLEQIEKLQLEMEKKQALLDYTYKGADGQGTVTVDDSLYYARNDTELKKMLDTAMRTVDWQLYREGINALALWAVALETTDPDDYATIGGIRFGGLPDLPQGTVYPTFATHQGDTMGYQFIAQLNCQLLAPHQKYLPRTGMLYFFITDQEDFSAKVIYHPGSTDMLRSARELDIDEADIYDEGGIYAPYRAIPAKWVSIPHFYSDDHLFTGPAAALADLVEDDDTHERTEGLRVALDAASKQQPVHGINCYVFKQHDSPQIEAANELHGKPEDFVVLLRVSSDRNPGFNFWDAGEIYFVIHKSDLAKGDFSNVICGLESS